ncbi:MAG: hypothetical protein ACI4O7_12480 [Aristaeellaceae bacterium]
MYQHYMSRKGSSMQPSGNTLLNRVRSVLILVLLAAVILLAVFGGKAMSFEAETRSTFLQRMQTECNDAVSLTTALSRTAGASSSATLSKIRSHVYAMDTINQLNVGLGGDYLISNDTFTNLYAIIDDYFNRLITGVVTGDSQTSLANALTSLQQTIASME